MPIIGKMILNGADFVPLNLYGVGVFMAFSGKGAYRNIPACMAVPNVGPIPPGNTGLLSVGGVACFHGLRQSHRIYITAFLTVLNLIAMNGLLYIVTI